MLSLHGLIRNRYNQHLQNASIRTSLVVQRLRIHLAMQDMHSIPDWGTEIPYAEGQLNLHSTTTEPLQQLKSMCTLMKTSSATTKTQHSHRKKERKKDVCEIYRGILMAQMVKNLPAVQETHCLENFMDRRAWWATVHGVTKESDTTEQLTHIYIF